MFDESFGDSQRFWLAIQGSSRIWPLGGTRMRIAAHRATFSGKTGARASLVKARAYVLACVSNRTMVWKGSYYAAVIRLVNLSSKSNFGGLANTLRR